MQVIYNSRVDSIELPTDLAAKPVDVVIAPAHGSTPTESNKSAVLTTLRAPRQISCNLLIGADGAASTVRQALREQHGAPEWEMRVRPSPSGDVHWKVRAFPLLVQRAGFVGGLLIQAWAVCLSMSVLCSVPAHVMAAA